MGYWKRVGVRSYRETRTIWTSYRLWLAVSGTAGALLLLAVREGWRALTNAKDVAVNGLCGAMVAYAGTFVISFIRSFKLLDDERTDEIANLTNSVAEAKRELQEVEQRYSDAPQIVLGYDGLTMPQGRLVDKMAAQSATLRNGGRLDAFSVQVHEICNGPFRAKVDEVGAIPAGGEKKVALNVEAGSHQVVLDGMPKLLRAEQANDVPNLMHVPTATRKIPVTITYKDIHKRRYRSECEIEFSYLDGKTVTRLLTYERLT